jgi:hypothetical protein
MNKMSVLGSFVIAAVIGGIVAIATSPTQLKANGASGVKGDRLPIQKIQKIRPACSQQAWPYYGSECVRDNRTPASQVPKVRLIAIAKL